MKSWRVSMMMSVVDNCDVGKEIARVQRHVAEIVYEKHPEVFKDMPRLWKDWCDYEEYTD